LYDEYLPFHPTFFKKQRQKFIDADKEYLTECSKCALKEKTHGLRNTQRGNMNRKIPDDIGEDIYRLEIAIDTTCNAACIQCGTLQSSLWRLEEAKEGVHGKVIHIQPESQIDSKINSINETINTQTVKRWHFWGGEPLLTDTHLKFLNKIEDLSDVSVAYTTNGSIFPSAEVLEIWSKCKEVVIGLSTDGIEDKFHYIRYPLSWNKWTGNAKSFKNDTPDNVRLHINYCVLPLNALYITEMDDWLSTNFNKHRDGSPINFDFIRGEGTLDVACTPMKLREAVWKNLGEHHTVSNILREVPVIDPSWMLSYLDRWDKHRNLDWRITFPDIVKYFEL
jgi:organic radical activating enzyme